jgi:hypothetical protein
VEGSTQEGTACKQAKNRDDTRGATYLEARCKKCRLMTIDISHVLLRAHCPHVSLLPKTDTKADAVK